MKEQQHKTTRRCGRAPAGWSQAVFVAAMLGTTGLAAQEVGPAGQRPWSFEPSVGINQIFTDNYRQDAAKQSDAITELVGAARLTGTRGFLRGYVDYSLAGSVFARHSEENELRHLLASALTAEVVQGMFFVDARASYSQQAVSAFGSQSATPSLAESNREDVASLAITPSLRGRLGGTVRYDARATREITRAKDTLTGDVDNTSALLHLDGGLPGARLGWSADATHDITDYAAGRRTFDTRVYAGLNYLVMHDLRLGVHAGRERTDIATVDAKSYTTGGLSAEWTPTERTLLAATVEKRFFGTGHSLRLSHRTPRTVWTLSSARDVSTSRAEGLAGFGSAYDLYFRQFASTEPDVVKRDVLVRSFLVSNNIDPRATVVSGFLASAVTLQNTQSASVALVGVRNTIRLQATTSRSERADAISTSFDDLSLSDVVRQRGLLLDWSFRLTPSSSLSAGASYQRTRGNLSSQASTLQTVTATWSATLGPRSSVAVGARYADFDSLTSPYEESALYASFRYAF